MKVCSLGYGRRTFVARRGGHPTVAEEIMTDAAEVVTILLRLPSRRYGFFRISENRIIFVAEKKVFCPKSLWR